MSTLNHTTCYLINSLPIVIHSTETAVIAVYDFIVQMIDSGEVCALVLFDLSLAFNLVDHDAITLADSSFQHQR